MLIQKKSLALISSLVAVFAIFSSCKKEESIIETTIREIETEEADGLYPYKWLSTYAFFDGEISNLNPSEDLIFYKPSSSLFTDYAHKTRFIQFPENEKADLVDGEFKFPEGTILVKNFYYPLDFQKPDDERRIIETRLLILEESGWEAYPYIWNEEQTNAQLKVIGGQKEVHFKDLEGKDQVVDYLIPNRNQCKTCHNKNEEMAPIGVQVKHLNNDLDFQSQHGNQLEYWSRAGKLEGFEGKEHYPSLINYENESLPLDERAMAYLDINCSHCHRTEGPASTSGLFLTYNEKDRMKLGINKTPVAAGIGAGSHKFDIVPGNPEESIIVHRMNSTDVGVAMPELGRTTIHEEGVELIREWIKSME